MTPDEVVSAPSLPEPIVRHLAAHHGVVTVAELASLGASRRQRARWVAEHHVRRRPGRLLLAPGWTDEWSPMAELAARFRGSAYAMETAAALHHLDGFEDGLSRTPTLFVPSGRRLAGARLLRREDLGVIDVVRVRGLPVTAVPRTLAELGASCRPDLVERAVECALRTGAASVDDVLAAIRRTARRGRAGPGVLAGILDRRGTRTPPTESDAETRFLQIVRHRALPEPVRQHRVMIDGRCCARVDFVYRHLGLRREVWIEIDGAETHSGSEALARDLHRQNDLMVFEPLLLRFTAVDVYEHPVYVRQRTWRQVGLSDAA